jgi:4-amino-4-deoxy-L-arabinose transferase-like glycosyltransferase
MKKALGAYATSLPVIVIFAFAVRLLSLLHYVSHHSRQALSVLPFLFESGNIAYAVASGSGFSSPFRVYTGPTAWMTPVYPSLLGGIFRLFGAYTFSAFLAAALLNILFATLTTIPLYLAAAKLGGRRLGAGTAWLWAIFPNAILLTYQSMWEACLAAFLAAAILWGTLALAENGRARNWIGYGLLWGLTLMTDPTLASTLPLLLAWLAWRAHRQGAALFSKQALGKPALGLAVALLCCVPWTIRNYAVFHTLVPLRSTLGLQLWMGNNAQATPIWHARLHPINNAAQRAEYVRLGEIAYMRQKMHAAIRYMLTHPRHEAELISRRFLAVWAGGTPYPLQDFLANRSPWFRYVLLFNLLAGIGAALGIVILFRKRNA